MFIFTIEKLLKRVNVVNQMKSPDLPNPRDLVLDKEVKVSNGIKGHQHREKNQLRRKYFQIQDLEEFN